MSFIVEISTHVPPFAATTHDRVTGTLQRGRLETEAALLDGQAAILDVKQAGALGDFAGPRRRDAELKPQRGRAGRDRLPCELRQPCRCIWAGTPCAALAACALAPTTVIVS
jgi:hypothetical protein